MSFSATGVPKPLQSRPKKSPFQLIRSSSSPFANHPRRKAATQAQSGVKRAQSDITKTDSSQPLDDTGIVTTLPPPKVPQDVVSLVHYIQQHTWNDVPERASGMNSTRTAEVLNFRLNMPPIVSIAHLHAVSASTTTTERELASLVERGIVKKVNILGRGKGGKAIGEGIVLIEDWVRLVQSHNGLDQALKEKYATMLEDNVSSYTITTSAFTQDEASELINAGFLTATSALSSDSSIYVRPGAPNLSGTSALAASGSTAPTGTLAATGGPSAIHTHGGGGRGLPVPSSTTNTPTPLQTLTFSLPNTGSYLRLVTESRLHLISLLAKSNRYKESTRDMLRERWDGGIPLDDAQSRAKRARGEWSGVLPGKTKKWKAFYGMRFEWVLEECLGAGTVECFDTGSVGVGVRVS